MRAPATLLDPVPGGVDRGEPVVGDADEFLRHAARDQPVGVIVGDTSLR